MSGRTISHHMLRRTARKREREIERALAVAENYADYAIPPGDEALQTLSGHGVRPGEHIKVEKSRRGPFGWRVVTY